MAHKTDSDDEYVPPAQVDYSSDEQQYSPPAANDCPTDYSSEEQDPYYLDEVEYIDPKDADWHTGSGATLSQNDNHSGYTYWAETHSNDTHSNDFHLGDNLSDDFHPEYLDETHPEYKNFVQNQQMIMDAVNQDMYRANKDLDYASDDDMDSDMDCDNENVESDYASDYMDVDQVDNGDEDGDSDYHEDEGSRKRKRGGWDDSYAGAVNDYGEDSDDDFPRRTRGAPTKLPRVDFGRSLRKRAEVTNYYGGQDELQEDDEDSFIVTSDIKRPGRPKLKRLSSRLAARTTKKITSASASAGNSDIEFESRRRSSRANKNTRKMVDRYMDDDDDENDDSFYISDHKPAAAPKVVSVKEIFQSNIPADFKKAHRLTCDSCGYPDDRNKGTFVFCQGCSNAYHKVCLGNRSSRDQRVTKVDHDSFVMQCRFCIGVYKKRDQRAPNHARCQTCHTKGPSCDPLSEKLTPKQEEKLRIDNGGVDPITEVGPKLINNVDHVLFRCAKCHRGWHYEHLPHPNATRDPSWSDPLNLRKLRLEEYQIDWMCRECRDTDGLKPDKIVAWRPADRKSYIEGQSITDFDEDQIEYLIKWERQSYNHCQWFPGAWVYGVLKHNMRVSFLKRTFGEGLEGGPDSEIKADSLLRWTEKEAIYNVWVTPDIILDVHTAPRTKEAEARYKARSREDKFQDDLSRIFHVVKIFVKFEGLGYEDAVWDTPPDSSDGALWEAYQEAYREYLNGKHFKTEPNRVMKERLQEFRELDFVKDIELKEQPEGLKRGQLMEYQINGVNWMLHNFRHDRSVILADEMGLGKTVQIVALLYTLIMVKPHIWPFLVVVPNATCANWRREIKKWAPDIRVVAYYGGRVSQTAAKDFELFPGGTRDMKAHVVIMSYDSVKDSETRSKFNSVKWAGLVVDEAQALKNDENSLYRALNTLNIPFKVLLTGTPLQNNKRELFNLLQFIDPSMKAEKLDQEYDEITSENLKHLHELIRPYFLRRTKAEVLTFLPTMAQIIVPVSMSVLQERLCKSIMEKNPQLIRSIFAQGKLKTNERGSLSNILMQLRKCLCHPFIYSQAIEDRNLSPELTRRNLIEASSKLMLLEIMLPKLKERGHRVLIFSQFLDQLTVLEDFLMSLNLRHERLDGSQSSLEKQKKIDAFNAPDSELFCMLLSTRAGGVGINLATADTVIILDPDWNPHQDIQALSRAHRIGQRKKVLCFQLVTVDSAEEKILQIGRKKMALDHLLIETMDNQDDAPNDVESVLKHGAEALFGDKKKEAIKYDSAAVDKLLDRSLQEETKTDNKKSAESAFAHARVWANDGLADDMKETEQQEMSLSVWDQILKQREEEARHEAEKARETLGRGGRRRGNANYAGPKFEFDDGEKPDSDQGEGDQDFVAKSEGDTSDEEVGTPATALSAQSRNFVVKGKREKKGRDGTGHAQQEEDDHHHPQEADSRYYPNCKLTQDNYSETEGHAQQGQGQGQGKANPHAAQVNGKAAGINGKVKRSSQIEVSLPKASPIGRSHGQLRQVSASVRFGSNVVPSPLGSLDHVAPREQQLRSVVPADDGDNVRVTQKHEVDGSMNASQRAGFDLLNSIAMRPAALASPVIGRIPVLPTQQQQGVIQGQQQQPMRRFVTTATEVGESQRVGGVIGEAAAVAVQAPRTTECVVCKYSHPRDWECPEMGQMGRLRVALDGLKRDDGRWSEGERAEWRVFLVEKLRLLRG
ncbi:putative Chromodomain-helicase-DNA-binding protein [Triangularia verruculosa]|uniref:Chromodomain-helicase-DNA-binding protein n=1 Tax=Triangularia verruculosa TaxID=2587418 RepID=A0AAN6XMX7_9PEZI|nr:putative Chromodomain-helicase-DNA-binding protein [Triangularia verruculosa]